MTLFSNSSSSSPFSALCRKRGLSAPPQRPPVPKKVPHTVSAHGVSWQDLYHWMSNANDPDFINYVHQENNYADAFMEDTNELQRTLYSEMISRMPSKISTPPERWGPWLYYQYIPEGKEYPVLCRKLINGGKDWMKKLVDYMTAGFRENILLDWNEIAELYGYVHVGTCRVSPNHNFLAYTLDITGSENFVLQIKDLRKDTIVPNYRVEGVVSLAWAQDSSTLFYTLCDQNQRPHRVQCIKMGSDSVDNTPLFVENDSRFCVDITSTKDSKFITVNSNSRTSSEVYIIDAVNPQSGIQRFRKRVSEVQYFLEHHHGFFYVLTNAPISNNVPSDSGNHYIAVCRADDLQSNDFLNIFLPSDNMFLLDMDIFDDHLVLFLNREGASSICSFDLPFPANCKIKDLRKDTIVPNYRVEGVVSLAWAQDSSTLFYTLCDQNQRPHRVQCIKMGSDSVDNTPLFVENDSRFCVDITSTKDSKFITVNSNSRTSSEVYIIDAVNPQSGIQRFRKRVSEVQYFLEHHHGFFYVLTNAPISNNVPSDSGNHYIAVCRADDLQSNDFLNIFLPSDNMFLLDMDIFDDHLVLFLNREGASSICSFDLPFPANCKSNMKIDDLNPWFFPLPSNICTISPGSNHDFTSSVYRVVLSSPVMPDVVIDYDMSRKTHRVVQQEVVTNIYPRAEGSLNVKNTDELLDTQIEGKKSSLQNEALGVVEFSRTYFCEKKEVISHDGVRVPLTIVYSREVHKEGQSPGLLHVYGAYGEVLDKSWCSDSLSLLDRGWVIAFADVRGGAGADPSWHRSGSGMHKLNSVYDFVSCGKYLVDEGYVHEHQLTTVAHSAGCLLVGAAINMHPHLFQAAILKVPFLDVCNTLLNPNLPLTVLDYEEFGNPQIKSQFHNILKYSPYDNIPGGVCCPSMLVTSSFNDSRVGVWEAAKWVAQIRDTACPTCSSSVILHSNMDGGHFSEGGRFGHCKEMAFEYAFLMKVLGISNKEN